MRVGILPVRAAAVEGERVGQPFLAGQLLGEAPGELAPLTGVQFTRQRELHFTVQPPVGALVLVRRRPAGARLVRRPRWHVAVLHMLAFLAVLGVTALTRDIISLRAGRLPTGSAAYAHLKVIHRTGPCSVCRLAQKTPERRTQGMPSSLIRVKPIRKILTATEHDVMVEILRLIVLYEDLKLELNLIRFPKDKVLDEVSTHYRA